MMPATSACDPAVPLDKYEDSFGGLWFGGDEVTGYYSSALNIRPVFGTCALASLHLRSSACGPGNTTAYLNVLADWTQDGDWNDVIACGGAGSGNACAPEWALKNAPLSLGPGCDSLDTPLFRVGPYTGGSWMRVTLTFSPVTDDFPWAGSAVNVNAGGGASGSFAGGETEDYPISIVTPVGVGEEPAGSLSFAPIAPNPARGSAEMRFTLPAASDVRLGVFDITGRRVRTLAEGRLAAGSHVVRWDGRDTSGAPLGSGLFFVRLEVAGRRLTHTVALMK
jgi:hypothetical protein